MGLLDLIILLIVAGICGALGQVIAGGVVWSRLRWAFCRCAVGNVVGADNALARTVCGTNWNYQFPDCLVNYRVSFVCGGTDAINATPSLVCQSVSKALRWSTDALRDCGLARRLGGLETNFGGSAVDVEAVLDGNDLPNSGTNDEPLFSK